MGLLLLLGDSGFRGALDTLGSGLESAWSVGRRLRTDYTGPIIRVRRSSDNVEQDFSGSGSLGAVSASAVASFCGAGDGFLTTIYDQSGNGRNFTQVTTTVQPIICESGTVVTEGSRIAAKFVAAASRQMEVATSTSLYNFLHTTGGSVAFIKKVDDTAASKTILSTKSSFTAAGCTIAFAPDESADVNIGRLDVAGVATAGNSVILSGPVVNTHSLIWYNLDPDNASAASRVFGWRNGTASTGINAQTGTPFIENAANNLTLGGRVTSNYMDGTIQELVIWSTIQNTSSRDAYESNAGTFYGLTVA